MPERWLRLRFAAAVAGLVLAALLSSVSPAGAEPSVDPVEPAACAADQVTVIVDFNQLGGKTRVACAPKGGTAARLFEQSGFPLVTTDAPSIPGFVCRVSGLPTDGPCGQGNAYWSLWWSAGPDGDPSPEWTYSTLGVIQLEIEPGGYLGFAWHQGNGSVRPPDVALPGDGAVAAEDEDDVVRGAEPVSPQAAEDADGPTTWLLVAGAVVVLAAASVVPLRRRRRS